MLHLSASAQVYHLLPQGEPHLIPLFAHQAAGEERLGIQPAQQVEGQLQGQEAQEVPLQQCFQTVGQMTQLCSTAQGNELVQGLVALLVAQRQKSGGDRLQPPLKSRLLHGHIRATCNSFNGVFMQEGSDRSHRSRTSPPGTLWTDVRDSVCTCGATVSRLRL